MEVDEVQAGGDAVSRAFGDEGARADYVLRDGTEVYVTRLIRDDRIQTTRQFVYDGVLRGVETMDRPVRPDGESDLWEGEPILVQTGSTAEYAGESEEPYRTGEIAITWEKSGDRVVLRKIVKEKVRLTDMTTVITTITLDDRDNPTKEQVRIRVTTNSQEIIVHAFTYSQYEEDSVLKTKVIRDDGTYSLFWWEDEAKITRFYDAAGFLVGEKRETGTHWDRQVTVTIFDSEGSIVQTRTTGIVFAEGEGGSMRVTKTLEDGKEIFLSIRESAQGYRIDRGGFSYIVIVDLTGGTVTLTALDGEVLGVVAIPHDGSLP